jgi:(p)ppGpp synthase/HD superfamily hydrolase
MIALLDRAIIFALRAHDGQWRKTGKQVPFVAHPFAVALILQGMGCDETVVAAALLHDTVEDSNATLADIEAEFGPEVRGIVAACTEPRGRWETRKLQLLANIRTAPIEAKLVAAADKYHNLRHMQHSVEKRGEQAWSRFSRGSGQQAWYYREMLASVRAGVQQPEQYPVIVALEAIIATLFAGIPSVSPEEAARARQAPPTS